MCIHFTMLFGPEEDHMNGQIWDTEKTKTFEFRFWNQIHPNSLGALEVGAKETQQERRINAWWTSLHIAKVIKSPKLTTFVYKGSEQGWEWDLNLLSSIVLFLSCLWS